MDRRIVRVGVVLFGTVICIALSSIFSPDLLPFVRVSVVEVERSETRSLQRVVVSNWSLVPITIEGADVSCSCVRTPALPVVVDRLSWRGLEFEVSRQRARADDLRIRFYPRAPHQRFQARLSP